MGKYLVFALIGLSYYVYGDFATTKEPLVYSKTPSLSVLTDNRGLLIAWREQTYQKC